MSKPKLPDWLRLVKGSLDGTGDGPVVLMLCCPVGFDPETWSGMTSERFGEILSYIPDDKDVLLLINTMGGYVHEGLGIYHLIRRRGNVDTCCIGYAASMGAIIMQGGRNRSMYPSTMMMIHDPYFDDGSQGDGNVLEVSRNNLVDLLAERTGTRRDTIAKMMEETTAMNPAEAKRLRFIDRVEKHGAEKNEFEIDEEAPQRAVEMFCRMARNNMATSRPPAKPGEKEKEKPMKLLLASLAIAGVIPKAELNEADATAAADAFARTNKAALDKVPDLENRVKAFEAQQKARVESAVAKAIEDKVLKSDRKDKMTALGVKDEVDFNEQLGDLYALKAEAKPTEEEVPGKRRHTAVPPVPAASAKGGKKAGETPAAEEDEDDGTPESKIKALNEEMKTCEPSRRATICRELRGLKGRGGCFKEKRPANAQN